MRHARVRAPRLGAGGSGDPAVQNRGQFFGPVGLGDIVIHPSSQTSLPVANQCAGGNSDDGGVFLAPGTFLVARIAAVARNPSISGIWRSIRTNG